MMEEKLRQAKEQVDKTRLFLEKYNNQQFSNHFIFYLIHCVFTINIFVLLHLLCCCFIQMNELEFYKVLS